MKYRATTFTCLAAASVFACGRLDLGGYAELPPESSNGSSVLPPVPTTGGASAGAAPQMAGSAGTASSGAGGAPSANPPASGNEAGDGGVGGVSGEGGLTGEGGWLEAGGAAGAGGEGPASGPQMKSCKNMGNICGPTEQSCCDVGYVAAGSVVRGGITNTDTQAEPSYVSAFYLSTFEVTVGRFRAFLQNYDAWRAGGAPRVGDGANPRVPGSGWRAEWVRQPGAPLGSHGLAATSAEVEEEVEICMTVPFSTSIVLQPVNCVSFYEAAAFCIWDGGRLPTDLEWEYAAAGGDENRTYPWGTEPPTRDYAAYGCSTNIGWPCHIPPVGSLLLGRGRFGQLDLAGSVSEWTLDTMGPPFPTPCYDCANVEPIYAENIRNTRGGNWTSDESTLVVASNRFMVPEVHLSEYGIRYAYDVIDE